MTNMLRVTAFPHLEMATKALVNSLFPHNFHKLIRKFKNTYQRYPRGIIPIPQTSDKLLPLLTILSAKLYTSFDSIPHPSPLLLRHIFTIPLLLTFSLFFLPYTQHLKKINANHPSFLGYGHVSHCVTNKTEKLHQILHTISSVFPLSVITPMLIYILV